MTVYLTLAQDGTVVSNHGNDAQAARATGLFILPWNAKRHAVPAVGSVYRA